MSVKEPVGTAYFLNFSGILQTLEGNSMRHSSRNILFVVLASVYGILRYRSSKQDHPLSKYILGSMSYSPSSATRKVPLLPPCYPWLTHY